MEEVEQFDFEKLEVYQRALDYIDFVYGLTQKFPKAELFRLTSHFQGAAQAIAFNIGEVSGGSKTESIHFLKMARRSVRECVVCTTIASRRNYIDKSKRHESRSRCWEISKLLTELPKSLK